MFETFLNAILISIMLLVQCHNPVVIREDRVFLYVGNDSNSATLTDSAAEESVLETKEETGLASETTSDVENIPESLLIQLKDIQNATDFIANFLMEDKTQKDIYLNYLERGFGSSDTHSEQQLNINEERTKLSKLPAIGTPAACVPEMTIIELKPDNSHSELYFPSCVRIPRCSGCCPSQRLHCVALNKSFEDISVIRVKYSPTELRLKFEGFKVFRIEKHDKCNCDCIQKSSQCSAKQIYSESECRCLCPDTSSVHECQKSGHKFWDHNRCQCECKSVPFCSTGMVFNRTTCRCESLNKPVVANSFSLLGSKSLGAHRYAINKRIDSEVEAQRSKSLGPLINKGINPDIDDRYHPNES